MNFKETSTKLHQNLKLLDPDSQVFMQQLLAYSSVLEKLFPLEFNLKLKDLKLDQLLNQMKETGGAMVKEIESFRLNPQLKTIEVTLGPDSLQAPIIDLNQFIITNLKLKPHSSDHYLALSFLSRMENFELFQITHGLILKD